MKNLINKLLESQRLTRPEAFSLMQGIANGSVNESQMAAVLSAYIMRAISLEELQGFRDALLELARKVELNNGEVIDLCGTGGDGKNTFNISTLSAFVVAGAGIPVAKHGNYGVSSASGSSNVMEHFGYKFSNDFDKLKRELHSTNVCFMHAPLFHPALKAIGPIRKQLGVKTFFNILGPLVNPSNPKFQVSGVFNIEVGRIYSYLLQSESKNFTVVHSLDGYDEVSLTSDIKVFTKNGEELLTPQKFGLNILRQEELHGGTSVPEAAEIFKSILENKATAAQKNVVIANSALAIKCFKGDISLIDSVDLARESIESGSALKSFKNLINQQ
ncbi:MAG: anthranilate phosphoribosyltransferase [Bacteroidales bacterium]|nr:MAG: anthranilate phosphoribosyltransferase [Bacteroidales bacterium]